MTNTRVNTKNVQIDRILALNDMIQSLNNSMSGKDKGTKYMFQNKWSGLTRDWLKASFHFMINFKAHVMISTRPEFHAPKISNWISCHIYVLQNLHPYSYLTYGVMIFSKSKYRSQFQIANIQIVIKLRPYTIYVYITLLLLIALTIYMITTTGQLTNIGTWEVKTGETDKTMVIILICST